MLPTMTKTTLAALVAATFSISAIAVAEPQQAPQQHQEAERGHYGDHDKADNSDKDFAEVMKRDPSYSRFAKAWEASDIEDELDSDSTYTVFVPTNEAFSGGHDGLAAHQNAQSQKGMEQAQARARDIQKKQHASQKTNVQHMLDEDDKEGLRELLSQHIVKGEVNRDAINEQGTTLETLNGKEVRITSAAGSMLVNNARVTEADIKTSNITVYRVDTILTDHGAPSE